MAAEVDRTLWVGNLSDKVSDELLYELFLQAGPLEKVSIAKEKDGRPKGYAFITFTHDDSVPYTLQLMDGMQLFGRSLKLQFRPGSSHLQQQQQQQQKQASLRNPYQHSSPISNNPHMNILPNMPMTMPVMNIMNIPVNPYMNNQHLCGQMSPMLQSHPPNFQRSNTWHGGEGSGSEGEYGRTDNRNSRGHHNRNGSRDHDHDRGAHSDRDHDRSHSRNRNESYQGSPGHYGDRHGGGNEHDFEAKKQRVMEKTSRMKQSYQRDSHGSHGHGSHGHSHKRGRY